MGGQVQLLRGWRPVTEATDDKPWTIDSIDAVAAALFAKSRQGRAAVHAEHRRRLSRRDTLDGVTHGADADAPTSRSTTSSSATSSSGCAPTAKASSPSCAPSGRSRSTRSRCRRPRSVDFPQGPGFWALTRYADVMQVSRDPDTFHSAPTSTRRHAGRDRGVARLDDQHGRAEAHEAAPDREPRLHAAPGREDRGVGARSRRRRSSTASRRSGECDFVTEIAAALPLQIICDMMGIPRDDTKRIFELTNMILGVGDPEYVQTIEELMAAGMELFQYGLALARGPARQPARRHHDHAHAGRGRRRERREHRLTPGELGSFFLLLVVAGNETTRNAISHGMLALTDHPDQRAAVDRPTSTASPRPRSRRSCAGRRRSSTSAAPRRATRSSAARRSRPARRS